MAHKVDILVGQRIQQRRWMLGMTQQRVAELVGVRFQQVQKYETGANRVCASRMWELARVLEVPVSFFFECLAGQAPTGAHAAGDIAQDRQAAELVRAYYGIPDIQRRKFLQLASVLGDVSRPIGGEGVVVTA